MKIKFEAETDIGSHKFPAGEHDVPEAVGLRAVEYGAECLDEPEPEAAPVKKAAKATKKTKGTQKRA